MEKIKEGLCLEGELVRGRKWKIRIGKIEGRNEVLGEE
jgi:hypothetical protein